MAGQNTHRTDPTVNWATSPFGFGPFPAPDFQGVLAPAPYPDYAGFGGVAWATLPIHDPVPKGGAYGLSPYGGCVVKVESVRSLGRESVPRQYRGFRGLGDSGYGYDPYGLSPYGLGDGGEGPEPVVVTGALSLNGYEIEIFFSRAIGDTDPYLYQPSSYEMHAIFGAADATTVSVRAEPLGFDESGGVLSVIIRHTGTTLGGSYGIVVNGPGGIDHQLVTLLTKGEAPPFVVTATGGDSILFTFADPMLEHTGASIGEDTGILDPNSYAFSSNPAYPIDLTPLVITHPYEGDLRKVHMTVKGMTSVQYTCNVSPALAFDYTCQMMPDEDPTIRGLEINPEQGSSYVNSGYLWLSKLRYRVYGWSFLDISGRVIPSFTTFQAHISFDAGGATYNPPLGAFTDLTVAYMVFEDGPVGTGVRVKVSMNRTTGVDYLRIQSGTFDEYLQQEWSSGLHTISMVRNQKAETYSILFDGLPISTVDFLDFNGAAEGLGAGISCVLASDSFDVSGFRVHDARFSATSTVYSGSWNFLHDDVCPPFTGSDALTRDHIMTQRGPLTKSWGDATPATKQDVEVLVNGTPVGVKDVNPYIGEIWPTYPIPLLPIGDPQADVKVNYYWMASPIMEMAGLNVPGLVLNQWVFPTAHASVPGDEGQPLGDPLYFPPDPPRDEPLRDDQFPIRFPMSIVLGPIDRPTPALIGHRYMGFQREYSALLNDPTTLLLNQDPFATSVDQFERTVSGESVAYDGTTTPPTAPLPWSLEGKDSGWVNVGLGTYTLIDSRTGPFEPGDPTVATYIRETDLTFPASATIVTRFVTDAMANLTPDGVFTGIGFGIHNNRNLYLIGLLLINGVRHLGMLADPRLLNNRQSWYLGPAATARLTNRTTLSIPTSEVPIGFSTGMRFQIFDHPQAGVYTATAVIPQCDGTTTVSIADSLAVPTPQFPTDPSLYGQNNPTVVFEVRWDEFPMTYRLVVDLDGKVADLIISGELSTPVFTIDNSVQPVPAPSQSALVLDLTGKGQVFWGSLSYLAANKSTWSFFRYGIVPYFSALEQPSIVVQTEMDSLPENNPTNEWFNTQSFGTSRVDSSGGIVVLKSTSASETVDYSFGYSRVEPCLNEDAGVDIRTKFRVDSGILGAGDVHVVINNGMREVRLANLIYAEGYPGMEYRRLVRMPVVSMAGIQNPEEQGWTLISGATATALNDEYDLILTQTAGQTRRYSAVFADADHDSGYRIAEAQIGVDSYTGNVSGETGIGFQVDIGPSRWLGLRLKGGSSPKVQMINQVDTVVAEYDFDWTDGEVHTYRVVGSFGVVSLFLDDEIVLPTLNIDLFPGGSGANTFVFGATNLIGGVVDSTLASVARWRSVSYLPTPDIHCLRTVGIWKGGDKDHINSWEIPRTDTSTAPNSEQFGPAIQVMDWRNAQEIRLLVKADWGVTMYRPDLPLPPYYEPESDDPGSGFINLTHEPSAGWINVEYSQLPIVQSAFGFISFGALDKRSVTQQRWDWVRYRLFKAVTNDYRAPQHMVLNQGVVITSGELTKDTDQESVIVQTIDNRRVSLLPANIYAADIWKVIDGTTVYTRESWTFDQDSQLITLGQDANYNNIYFSGDHVPVNIIFIPGTPVTNTYLEQQALLDSVTLLNEGTPPIPKSQVGDIQKGMTYRDILNESYDPLNDPGGLALTDPYRILTHEVDPSVLYESLSFMEVTNGGMTGLIAIAGEGTLPEGFSGYSPTEGRAVGAHVLDLSGTKFWQEAKFPKPEDFEQGGGAPGETLFCSGGDYMGPTAVTAPPSIGDPSTWKAGLMRPLGGTLGPGSAVLHPNFPSQGIKRGTDAGKINRRTEWYLRIGGIAHTVHPEPPPPPPPPPPPESIGGGFGEERYGLDEYGLGGGAIRSPRRMSRGFRGPYDPYVYTTTPLMETVQWPLADNTPPSRPPTWDPNPNGTPNPNHTGACLAVSNSAGNYSRIGPWGGWPSLEPKPDTGYFEFFGTLVNGTTVTIREEFSGDEATFTARAVPTLPREFAIAPNPHVSLAEVINTDVLMSTYVLATPGIAMSGNEAVEITALAPVTTTNMLVLVTSSMAIIRLTGVQFNASGVGLLTGGAKITQSSRLAGGYTTIKPGGDISRRSLHDPLLGMICQGGQVLPAGQEICTIIYAATGS